MGSRSSACYGSSLPAASYWTVIVPFMPIARWGVQ
jgi:hypothetical protein